MRYPRLSSEELLHAQNATLQATRRNYGWVAQTLFLIMDIFYGKKRTFSKFKVLEIIARVPYQSWEHVAYIAMTHAYRKVDLARRIFDYLEESRSHQDNEQWHLLILQEIIARREIREDYFRYRVLPQVIAFVYYHISWLFYVIHPRLSYSLNADFEDHAQHEYMNFVHENPDLETEKFSSVFEKDYGCFSSVADLLRQIGHDEKIHKEESLARLIDPRFH